MSQVFRESLRVFLSGVLGIFLIFYGFKMLGVRNTEALVRQEFSFFRTEDLQVRHLNFFRGDFLVELRSSSAQTLKWTFNRLTGELIPWGTKEIRLQKKTGTKP